MRYEWQSDGTITRDGTIVARAEKSFWRERATLSVEGRDYEVSSHGFTGGTIEVTLAGAVHRTLVRQGWSVSRWTVTGGPVELTVAPAGWLTQRMTVSDTTQTIGELATSSFFSRRPVFDVVVGPESEPPVLDVVVLLWLDSVVLRRRSNAAAQGAT
ncbi:hypothetical protein [Nocardioides acrostichi]|uniref:Uncharacterized protein n=1 Tax=Nocardioides acrostichi TaxID=2784339 RepID=A0A930UWI2_9ACTN|nr:hypothetical protein [Nocardioides acrostichi]MBF4160962.1 hypothetical protein [Nocardioides acrostichi]